MEGAESAPPLGCGLKATSSLRRLGPLKSLVAAVPQPFDWPAELNGPPGAPRRCRLSCAGLATAASWAGIDAAAPLWPRCAAARCGAKGQHLSVLANIWSICIIDEVATKKLVARAQTYHDALTVIAYRVIRYCSSISFVTGLLRMLDGQLKKYCLFLYNCCSMTLSPFCVDYAFRGW